MPTPLNAPLIEFLHDQAAEGVGSFTSTPLVVAGLAKDDDEAVALLLRLSAEGVLDATAIVRCDRGHDKLWIRRYQPGQGIPEGACGDCGEEGRDDNFEEGGIVLVFNKGQGFDESSGGREPTRTGGGKPPAPSGRMEGAMGSPWTAIVSPASRHSWSPLPNVGRPS